MIDTNLLLADCTRLVRTLVDGLRQLGGNDPHLSHEATRVHVDAEYERARAAGRTALTRSEWAEGLYQQVAVAWVLGAVFVRFCEDNALVDAPLLSGPGSRRSLADERRNAWLIAHPAEDHRGWLREVFGELRQLPATGEVFGAHNPIWELAPSADGAKAIWDLFQQLDPATGALRHDFTDPTWSTRFLGDLYQDLSEHAKKTYALLQTPVFVEEFILDRTLTPALATFGLRDVTVLDPTCGSGHFLLGAFARLVAEWERAEPAMAPKMRAQKALDAIGGVDLNPFAAAIARFRLLVAALQAGGDTRLASAPSYTVHIAVGDSLLHGTIYGQMSELLDFEQRSAASLHGYASEDVEQATALLSREWAVVVGNPPYITVKDKALGDQYRQRYLTCHRQYSLGVPFTERFFQLAAASPTNTERSGYVGMITANSFMKREFGKKLIEQWVPDHDLTHVIDTSGAYIPGHGTPTVILLGRNRRPVARTVRAVLGIRGEPSRPAEPEKGLVWSSIVGLIDEPGFQSEFVSVTDLERPRLAKHPWSIGGGGAAELKERLDRGRTELRSCIDVVSTLVITREDDAYFAPSGRWSTVAVPPAHVIPMGTGESVRDYVARPLLDSLFPYDSRLEPSLGNSPALLRLLWPAKQYLIRRKELGGTQLEVGRTWFEWNRFLIHRYRTPLSIAFAFVATHNHFVLDRGGKVFKQSAPVIKLPAGATVDDHLALLGVLNSSTACFWMHQASHNKGRPGAEAAAADEPYEHRFEFDGTKLQAFPLPSRRPVETARRIDELAAELSATSPSAVAESGVPAAARLAEARARHNTIRAEMIGLQEQLDWENLAAYGLTDEPLTLPDGEPPLALGERAFEIVLARKMADGDEDSSWFTRHGSTPITEVASHWSDDYRRLVERRIELIETDLDVSLVERPEHKRRWAQASWDDRQRDALRAWLLDRLESPRYWRSVGLTSCARLAAEARGDAEFMEVAGVYAGANVDLGKLVAELVAGEAVPYLAAYRYSESGLRKWEEWLAVWDLQRREDAGEQVGEIPVPPKYAKPDFTGAGWELRGKLDVPKERFVSYPGAQSETDASLVVGWAGWDHGQRARALAGAYLAAKSAGRDVAHLTPLLAGLDELVPWLRQWFDDPASGRAGTEVAGFLAAELKALGLTVDTLRTWRPPATTRTRRR